MRVTVPREMRYANASGCYANASGCYANASGGGQAQTRLRSP
jgi:hypothetical protein